MPWNESWLFEVFWLAVSRYTTWLALPLWITILVLEDVVFEGKKKSIQYTSTQRGLRNVSRH